MVRRTEHDEQLVNSLPEHLKPLFSGRGWGYSDESGESSFVGKVPIHIKIHTIEGTHVTRRRWQPTRAAGFDAEATVLFMREHGDWYLVPHTVGLRISHPHTDCMEPAFMKHDNQGRFRANNEEELKLAIAHLNNILNGVNIESLALAYPYWDKRIKRMMPVPIRKYLTTLYRANKRDDSGDPLWAEVTKLRDELKKIGTPLEEVVWSL